MNEWIINEWMNKWMNWCDLLSFNEARILVWSFSLNICWGSPFLLAVSGFAVIAGFPLFGPPRDFGRYRRLKSFEIVCRCPLLTKGYVGNAFSESPLSLHNDIFTYFGELFLFLSIWSVFYKYYHYFINIIIILSILSLFYQYYHYFNNIIIILQILSLFYQYYNYFKNIIIIL